MPLHFSVYIVTLDNPMVFQCFRRQVQSLKLPCQFDFLSNPRQFVSPSHNPTTMLLFTVTHFTLHLVIHSVHKVNTDRFLVEASQVCLIEIEDCQSLSVTTCLLVLLSDPAILVTMNL